MKTPYWKTKRAIRSVSDWIDYRLRKVLARALAVEGESGHNRLCRLVSYVCHCGPHGTFVNVHSEDLQSGGNYCIYGSQCGKPTESYTEQMNEQLEAFYHIQDLLRKSGALTEMVWENPRFAVSTLCDCGQPNNRALSDHAPLCRYRIEHDFPVSVEEYKLAIGSVN